MLFMGLLFVNIVILIIMMVLGNSMNEMLMYGLLFYIMISTPVYLFIQLRNIRKSAEKKK